MDATAAFLDDAQRSRAGRAKALQRFVAAVRDAGDAENADPNAEPGGGDAAGLVEGVCGGLDRLFLFPKLEPAVQRGLEFVAAIPGALATAGTPASEVAAALLRHGCERAGAEDKAVRARACGFLGELLARLGDVDLDAEVVEQLEAVVEKRLRDRAPQVRVAAARAAALLQLDEGDAPGPQAITAALVRRMGGDASKEVRARAVTAVALAPDTILALLDRVRDVHREVRRAAVIRLARDVDVKCITPAQRVRIVTAVLKDRSPEIRDLGTAMVLGRWLPAVDLTMARLLALLDPASDADAPALVLRALFTWSYARSDAAVEELAQAAAKAFAADGSAWEADAGRWVRLVTQSLAAVRKTTVDLERYSAAILKKKTATMGVTPEGIFFLAQKLRFLRQHQDDEVLSPGRRLALLDACAPAPPAIADLLEAVAMEGGDADGDAFIIEAVLRCVSLVNVEEEGGRRRLLETLLTVLQHLPIDAVLDLFGHALSALSAVCESEVDLVDVVVTLVMELEKPQDAEPDASDEDEAEPSNPQEPEAEVRYRQAALLAALLERLTPSCARHEAVALLLASGAQKLMMWLLEDASGVSADPDMPADLDLRGDLQELCVLGLGRYLLLKCAAQGALAPAPEVREMELVLLRVATLPQTFSDALILTCLHSLVDLALLQRHLGAASSADPNESATVLDHEITEGDPDNEDREEPSFTLVDLVLDQCGSDVVEAARMGRELGAKLLYWHMMDNGLLNRAMLADLIYFYFDDAAQAQAATPASATALQHGSRGRLQQLLSVFFEHHARGGLSESPEKVEAHDSGVKGEETEKAAEAGDADVDADAHADAEGGAEGDGQVNAPSDGVASVRAQKVIFRNCVADVLATAVKVLNDEDGGDGRMVVATATKAVQYIFTLVADCAVAADGVALGLLYFLLSTPSSPELKPLFSAVCKILASLPPSTSVPMLKAQMHVAHSAINVMVNLKRDQSACNNLIRFFETCEAELPEEDRDDFEEEAENGQMYKAMASAAYPTDLALPGEWTELLFVGGQEEEEGAKGDSDASSGSGEASEDEDSDAEGDQPDPAMDPAPGTEEAMMSTAGAAAGTPEASDRCGSGADDFEEGGEHSASSNDDDEDYESE